MPNSHNIFALSLLARFITILYAFDMVDTSLWDSEDRMLARRIDGHRVLDSPTIAT